jgi:hypothetical protein
MLYLLGDLTFFFLSLWLWEELMAADWSSANHEERKSPTHQVPYLGRLSPTLNTGFPPRRVAVCHGLHTPVSQRTLRLRENG